MLKICNQIVAFIYQFPIGLNNGRTLWHRFHSRRIICSVKSIRSWDRLVVGVVWQKQVQLYFWMLLFCLLYRSCRHTIKCTVVSNGKASHTILANMLLHHLFQLFLYVLRYPTMANKKATFHIASPPRQIITDID